MRRTFTAVVIIAIFMFGFAPASKASVEWLIQGSLDVGDVPLDVATSADGKWTFILTAGGDILIYSAAGELEERLATKEPGDGIEVSPLGDRIFLLSREKKTVKIISLDFIQKIDESGSPLKGPTDAPVVVAVYSDFQ